MKYNLTRTCKSNHKKEFHISKREAAFDLYEKIEKYNLECPKCNGNEFFFGLNKPKFDKDLFLEWLDNPGLYFSSEEEEYLLSEIDYTDIFFDLIDNYKIPEKKLEVISVALYYIIFKNLNALKNSKLNPKQISEKEIAIDKARKGVIKRKDMLHPEVKFMINGII